jgi:ribose transport system permease protein
MTETATKNGGSDSGGNTSPDGDGASTRSSRRAWFSSALVRYTLILVLALLIVLFSLLRPATFPTYVNFVAIVSSQDVLVVLAVGLLFPLVAGEFDLSIGFTLGFTAMELAVLTGQVGMPVGLALLVSVLTGAVIGAINAVLVLRFQVNAFIATLGSGTVLQGLTLWLSAGSVVAGLPDVVSTIGTSSIGNIPYLVFFALLLSVVVYYVLEHTPFGRYLYATGSGRDAARLAGVRTEVLLAIAFVLSGLVSGLAGVMQTTVLGSANPDVGAQFLLPAFAAGFLGATAIKPGRFNVPGTILALFVLAIGIAGLSQLGAPLWVSPVFNGLALILAVALAVRRRRSITAGA